MSNTYVGHLHHDFSLSSAASLYDFFNRRLIVLPDNTIVSSTFDEYILFDRNNNIVWRHYDPLIYQRFVTELFLAKRSLELLRSEHRKK